jgi:hypothetical protein
MFAMSCKKLVVDIDLAVALSMLNLEQTLFTPKWYHHL